MTAQKLICLAKEARSLVAFCEESLSLIGRHMAARAVHGDGAIPPDGLASASPHIRINLETAKQTRALAEDERDPEIRRLLQALADRYDEMAIPDSEHGRLLPNLWK
jgi:hypothetical protein